MKVAFINLSYGIGSTGKIIECIGNRLMNNGDSVYFFCSSKKYISKKQENIYIIKSNFGHFLSIVATRFFGGHGFYDYFDTIKMIKRLKKINPDIIHLHNVHGFYLNNELLFKYLAKTKKPVVWTLHDCWAFTGHCAYFDYVKCDKWKNGCYSCQQLDKYPISYIDRSEKNYSKKKKVFNMLSRDQLVLVTPSKWLLNLVQDSFLSKYNCQIINNGINVNLFKPINSNFRKKYNCIDKKIVLSVSFGFNERKGILDLNKLCELLGKDYQIILVGINSKYKDKFSDNILLISKTNNQEELAEIYSSADVFVNLTYEDNFPTTNLESLACGTPVITYDTGGSSESLNYEVGYKEKQGDLEAVANDIRKICSKKSDNINSRCVKHTLNKFTEDKMSQEYMQLYEQLVKKVNNYGRYN